MMSDITISRPELVNGHTDVICSTSIRHILAVRKSALLQIDTLIRQLAEISVLTESIGGKTALDWAMKQDFRCGCWLMEKPETAMKAITRNLDREIWRDLMQHSGMLSLMDAQAHDTWYRSLEYDNFPEISEANILSTLRFRFLRSPAKILFHSKFEQLHQNKDDVFERGVINLFRGLSWNYKTNCPCKFGNKIIVNNLVRWDRWGLHLITGQQADRLADLERMLHLFSGKPIPDSRENIIIRLDDHIRSVQGKACYEDEMFSIRYFKKGSAHITFRKPELVDRLNDIIARHYPNVLADR
ncbi:restriction methylase [Escherichia coli]|uniref:Restriction methylase n=1 Tax=Escherichia coli TaxID=562 RepID=A0A8S0FKX6_ECOLX|nr:restriction methylase [Escherichia coli]